VASFWDALVTWVLACLIIAGVIQAVASWKQHDRRGVAIGIGAAFAVIVLVGLVALGTRLGWFNNKKGWECQAGPPPLFLICDSDKGDFVGI
jgi:hypothetical protein